LCGTNLCLYFLDAHLKAPENQILGVYKKVAKAFGVSVDDLIK